MKTKNLIATIILVTLAINCLAQTVVITDDPAYTTGKASSVLDIKSTSKGLLIPRLTQSERNLISSPEVGLMIFQTDGTAGFYYYSSTGWTAVGGSSSGGIQSVTRAAKPASPSVGQVIWCSDCGPIPGELQVWNGTSWTNTMGGTALPSLPQVTSASVTNVKSTTGYCGGTIVSDGGGTITQKGVCWSTSHNPTVSLSTKTNDAAASPYASYVTDLNPSSTYYVRAYATNAAGTVYGEERTITTIAYALGHPAFGGIIANLTGQKFVVSAVDIGISYWGCMGTSVSGADGTAIGTGLQNTQDIIGAGCMDYSMAAWSCSSYSSLGHGDWHLPSQSELDRIYTNRGSLGITFTSDYYLSSTEMSSNTAYGRYLTSTSSGSLSKDLYFYVRAVKYFY
jgi:hypothetical protein